MTGLAMSLPAAALTPTCAVCYTPAMDPRSPDNQLGPEPQVSDVWSVAAASAGGGLLFMLLMSLLNNFLTLGDYVFAALVSGAAGAATHGLLRWLAGKLGLRAAKRSHLAWSITYLVWAALLVGRMGGSDEALPCLLLSTIAGAALGHLLLRRRWRQAKTAPPLPVALRVDADLEAIQTTAHEDAARLGELAHSPADPECEADLRSLAASAETALAEVERLIPRLVLLRQVTAAHPRDERARTREQRAFDRLMALGQAIEEAAETAAAYAAGQPVAARLTGEVRQMERLVESYGELERELGAEG
ncbi:MAG: hypothetical protein HYU66_09565 [Armatimonadetes bacterium]|nr:hypothetical protein [Armatimonadota bacterium]